MDQALSGAAKTLEAEYYAPYLAHATMEPQNCTAHVTADGVEIWVPSQNGEAALAAAAEAAGVDPSRVVVHKTILGGGFGRRGSSQDYRAASRAHRAGRGPTCQTAVVARGGHGARFLPPCGHGAFYCRA